MTQAGFVRIVSNPAFSRRVVSPRDALEVLRANLQHRAHRFGLTILGRRSACSVRQGDSMVTSKSRTGICSLWRFTRREGLATLDSGVASLLADQPVTKRNISVLV